MQLDLVNGDQHLVPFAVSSKRVQQILVRVVKTGDGPIDSLYCIPPLLDRARLDLISVQLLILSIDIHT